MNTAKDLHFLISGGSGFIGSHTVKYIISNNLGKVTLLLSNKSNLWRLEPLKNSFNSIIINYENYEESYDLLKNSGINNVIHAGWSGVLNEDRNSLSQIKNINSTINLLNLCKNLEIRNFTALGSHAEYGIINGIVNERHETNPTTLYGTTKLSMYLLCRKICEIYGISLKWIRVFNTFGPLDNPIWLIPYLINSLLNNNTPELTKCEQKWDYLYIKDAAEAIVKLSMSPVTSGIYNLGSGHAIELKEVVEIIKNQIKPQCLIKYGARPYREDQLMHLQADISKLFNDINWVPRYNIFDSITETIEWHKSQNDPSALI
jgi:UDP-glucose 4-epimerase